MSATGPQPGGLCEPPVDREGNIMTVWKHKRLVLALTLLFLMSLLVLSVQARSPITFTDATAQAGITYKRARSANFTEMQAIRDESLRTPIPADPRPQLNMPHRVHGLPGVAIGDFDGDGDQDVYATNGPGRANSLYSNQWIEIGALTFIDVATTANVDATAQDSNGVCYGDIDNDGDHDLLVLGRSEPNHLYTNNGNGMFTQVNSGDLEGGTRNASSCAFGDVNADGLLDVFLGNSWDFTSYGPCFADIPGNPIQHNQLFLNNGDHTFTDVSAARGVENLTTLQDIDGVITEVHGVPTITWAVAMLDIDQDGDTDIIHGDDQCGRFSIRDAQAFGIPDARDFGFIHVLLNDGTGHFTDQPVNLRRTESSSAWMGFSFGDFNCDGKLDLFGSSAGDYFFPNIEVPQPLGHHSSRWFLGDSSGGFQDPGVGRLVATPFGWGTGALDYDNDGDQDIIFHGGLDVNLRADASNPGVLLNNRHCTAEFSWDQAALDLNYATRNIQGMAIGDLNNDGFVDMVTAANFMQPSANLIPGADLSNDPPFFGPPWGSIFDPVNLITAAFDFDSSANGFVWNGLDYPEGELSVEVNSADNGHHWVAVTVQGTKGITTDGTVNRDGIGAVVHFTPQKGKTVMKPIVAGSSYASQNSLIAHFGLGRANKGTVDVFWPGGVRNRLFGVKNSETILFPEIPCSFDADWSSPKAYRSCVREALTELVGSDVLTARQAVRFGTSAIVAFVKR